MTGSSTTPQQEREEGTGLVFIDGRDALAFVIIWPSEIGDGVAIEASSSGLSKPQAAYILRHVADQWDPEGRS